MYATYKAIKINSTSSSDTFVIINESLSVLTSISNSCYTDELVQHVQEMPTTTEKQITCMRVPSRVEILGNEKSDLMANKTTSFQSYVKIDLITTSREFDNI